MMIRFPARCVLNGFVRVKLYPQVKPEISLDDFDDEALSWEKQSSPMDFIF